LEEIVMPVVLNLPNILDTTVTERETVIRDDNMDLKRRKRSFKQLDYRQLSYINESVFSSLIGPDSRFAVGRIAQLHYSIIDAAVNHLRNCGYQDYLGMDMAKSAVMEAVRCKGERIYNCDPYRIDRGYEGEKESQQLHLNGESSLEAFASFISRFVFMKTVSDQLRLFSSGCEYEVDAGGKGLKQKHTIRATSILKNGSAEESMKESHQLLDNLWPLFSSLEVPIQAVKVAAPLLLSNEASRTDIKVYSSSDNDWVRVGYISNLSDYVTKRLGVSNRHLVTAVIDIQPIASCIIETHQTEKGSFNIPRAIDMFS
jgi:seryl-tRNA synthetase